MTRAALLLALLALTGCLQTMTAQDVAAIVKAASTDPATVCSRIVAAPYVVIENARLNADQTEVDCGSIKIVRGATGPGGTVQVPVPVGATVTVTPK